MDDVLREFVTETMEAVDNVDRDLVRFEREPNNQDILAHIFRLVHTIKGTCGFLGLPRLETLSHGAESLIHHFRDGGVVTTEAVTLILATIDRIKAILRAIETTEAEPDGSDDDLISRLVAASGEGEPPPAQPAPAPAAPEAPEASAAPPPTPPAQPIPPPEPAAPAQAWDAPDVTLHEGPTAEVRPPLELPAGRTQAASPQTQSIRVGLETLESLMTMVSELVLTRNQLIEIARRTDNADFKVPLQRLSSVTAELQERVMKTRMQPISTAWQKLPRLVRDLCAELGKDIELSLTGAETELDRQVLELVKDPFTHLIRNAADHGIETPEERRRAGKSPRGQISLTASHESGTITIEIADDGRGLDVGRVAAKAIERGLASPAEIERMSPERIARFIFEPGFTTAAAVSHVSGRGIGMDVVRSNIELIGGSVDIRWTRDEGTAFTLKIPLTLAIVATLIIETAGQRFAIPQVAVVELVQARNTPESRLESINGRWLLRLRESLLPVVRLADILGLAEEDATHRQPDSEFIVVLKVGKRSFGLAVDAVFHTEEIVVKPMSSLLKGINLFSGNTILGDGAVILILDPSGLLPRIGDQPASLAPLGADELPQTRRLQQEKTSFLVFRVGLGEHKAVPLSAVTRLEEFPVEAIETVGGRTVAQYRGDLIPILTTGVASPLREDGVQPVLVFSERDRTAGIAVDEIVDIVEDHLDIRPAGQSAGIVGSAVIRGRATEILDIAHLLCQAIPGWFDAPAKAAAPGPRRVLLVDPAPFFRGMLVPVLKAAGFDVIALAEIEAAANLIQRSGETIDAVVADVEAPGRNGFDLAEELAANRHRRQVPFIGLAARLDPQALAKARDLGFADFVAKFDRAGLVAAIEEATEPSDLAA